MQAPPEPDLASYRKTLIYPFRFITLMSRHEPYESFHINARLASHPDHTTAATQQAHTLTSHYTSSSQSSASLSRHTSLQKFASHTHTPIMNH
jgi:hypothetical protein